MRMTRRIWIQLAILSVISCAAALSMTIGYIRVPALLGFGRYDVTVELPKAAGLYDRANVTYNGTQVGQVTNVDLSATGVVAQLSLRSDIHIPSDLTAAVHSTSAVGEQYIALQPRNGASAPLKDGDVISTERVTTPPDINHLLDATNVGLQAIPGDDLQTAIDEASTAVAGLGPDLSRLVRGSTQLAIDADHNLPHLLNVVDRVGPLLDTQTSTATAISRWADHLNTLTRQLADHHGDVANILQRGAPAADQVNDLLDKLQPTLPVLAANLASIAPVLITYQPNLEQLLVLLPQSIANGQGIGLANRGTKQSYKGGFLSFNLNLNLPPPCATGFLPAQQVRNPALQDYPDRPTGDLYCRVPQDSPQNVRGARNLPCETRPGKRAPTVKLCESDERYVPLNDGTTWKGDPNATWSGQAIPQLPPGAPAPPNAPKTPGPPPLRAVPYDPATGAYLAPDGSIATQTDPTPANGPRTWQSLLIPPGGR